MDQQQDFKKLQRAVAIRFSGALLSFFGIMVAMLPLAPAFRQFFRSHIGGTLGECLLGLSFPLIASPPAIAFLVWATRNEGRFKQLGNRESDGSHDDDTV